MGYEPFQGHKAERKMVMLGNKANQSTSSHSPRASNYSAEVRLEQVANLNDAKSFNSQTCTPSTISYTQSFILVPHKGRVNKMYFSVEYNTSVVRRTICILSLLNFLAKIKVYDFKK